jgi:hypothetical protein
MVMWYRNKFIIIFYMLFRIFSLTFHQNSVWESCIYIFRTVAGTNCIRSTRVCNEPNLHYEICYVTSCRSSNVGTVESTEIHFHNTHQHESKMQVYYEKGLTLNNTSQTKIVFSTLFMQHLLK